MIVRLPSLVITARRIVAGNLERCTIFDDKDMNIEMRGGLGKALTTEKSLWVDFNATTLQALQALMVAMRNPKLAALGPRCPRSSTICFQDRGCSALHGIGGLR